MIHKYDFIKEKEKAVNVEKYRWVCVCVCRISSDLEGITYNVLKSMFNILELPNTLYKFLKDSVYML